MEKKMQTYKGGKHVFSTGDAQLPIVYSSSQRVGYDGAGHWPDAQEEEVKRRDKRRRSKKNTRWKRRRRRRSISSKMRKMVNSRRKRRRRIKKKGARGGRGVHGRRWRRN
ncbi:hypothetical protein PoB_003387200 [Plakobranchus ocellatus]|uniref:Uncharacterized protein n=1 Tax=Plakobranchus ocellatus TaxID=259542 RepID=A0AAV4AK39_9GAST|nr:hypothetical protein PoB_003387200 [Plakobranchus ocellatus]